MRDERCWDGDGDGALLGYLLTCLSIDRSSDRNGGDKGNARRALRRTCCVTGTQAGTTNAGAACAWLRRWGCDLVGFGSCGLLGGLFGVEMGRWWGWAWMVAKERKGKVRAAVLEGGVVQGRSETPAPHCSWNQRGKDISEHCWISYIEFSSG